MTTVSGPALAPSQPRLRPGDALAALGLIVVELLLGWFFYDIVNALSDRATSRRLVQWALELLPVLPLAVVVTVHAVRRGRGTAAGLLALAAGAVTIGHNELVRWVFIGGGPHLSYDAIRTIGYVSAMAVATLAALSWGVSRREGRWWPLGLLVAAAGAALTLRTNWPGRVAWSHFGNPYDTDAIRRAELVQTVALMLPVAAACLACWLIDAASRSRSDPEP